SGSSSNSDMFSLENGVEIGVVAQVLWFFRSRFDFERLVHSLQERAGCYLDRFALSASNVDEFRSVALETAWVEPLGQQTVLPANQVGGQRRCQRDLQRCPTLVRRSSLR